MSGRRRPGAALWACLVPTLLGGLLRLAYALRCAGAWLPHADRGEGYYEGAVNFLGYRVLADRLPAFAPVGLRGPLYPAFLVLVETPFALPHPAHAVFAQAALSTLAVAAVYELGAALGSPWAGLLAALWTALDARQIELVGRLDLACFYQIVMLAVTAALAGWVLAPSRRSTMLLAAALAASLLCRSAHAALPLVGLAACAALPAWRPARRRLALLAGASAALLLAGLGAAALRAGRLVPLDAQLGAQRFYAATLGETCCTEAQTDRFRQDARAAGLPTATIEDFNDSIARLALRGIRRRPAAFAREWARNALEFWRPYAPALTLGLAAAAVHLAQPGFQALLVVLAGFAGYYSLTLYAWHSSVVLPLVAVLAGLGLAALPRLLSPRALRAPFFTRRAPGLGPAGAALVWLLAGLYAASLGLFAAEAAARRSGRLSAALGDPAAAAHRAPLALLDLSVSASSGRYGLEERSQALAASGRPERACADLRRLARLFPSGENARRARACAAQTPLGPQALAALKTEVLPREGAAALAADLSLATPCDWAGWADSGPEGRALLDRCVAADPADARSRATRGVLRFVSGDKRGSLEDLRAAARAEPGYAPAQLSLSAALYAAGQRRQALAAAERAAALARAAHDPALLAAAADAAASARAGLSKPRR